MSHPNASLFKRAHRAARTVRSQFETYRAAFVVSLRRVRLAESQARYVADRVERPFTATFTKVNGEPRRMVFKSLGDQAGVSAGGDHILTVWDTQRDGYRRIYLDTLETLVAEEDRDAIAPGTTAVSTRQPAPLGRPRWGDGLNASQMQEAMEYLF